MKKKLKERSIGIRDETLLLHNTSKRVGGVLVDLCDELEGQSVRIQNNATDIQKLSERIDDLETYITDIVISVSPSSVTFPASGGDATLKVYSIIAWEVI